MPYYVQITTEKSKVITADCGAESIAGRLANTSSNAGADYSYVYSYELDIEQPHNEHGAGNISSAPALHTATFVLPDYEPITALILNVLQAQEKVTELVFNQTSNQQNGKLLGKYTMSNGMLIGYKHVVDDQRDPEAQKQRGHVILGFKFEKIAYHDAISNKDGTLTSTNS